MALPAPFSGWLLEAGRRLPAQMNDYPRQNPAYRLTPSPAARLDSGVGNSSETLACFKALLPPSLEFPPCSPGARDGENLALKVHEPHVVTRRDSHWSVGFFARTLTYSVYARASVEKSALHTDRSRRRKSLAGDCAGPVAGPGLLCKIAQNTRYLNKTL